MRYIEENHQREQYFFDSQTVTELASFLAQFERPCCLCAPMIGRELHARGRSIRVLDADDRFADLPGFVKWDLYRPRHLDEEFDLILCDPPFFNVSLSQLFKAIRLLCHFELTRRIMISYPVRRQQALMRVFAPFGIAETGWMPGYLTVQHCEKNEIQFYANFCVEKGTIPSNR